MGVYFPRGNKILVGGGDPSNNVTDFEVRRDFRLSELYRIKPGTGAEPAGSALLL